MRNPFEKPAHTYCFYNLANRRDPKQVRRELAAIALKNPKVIGLVEAIGYALPVIPGYRLAMRDNTRLSRANIAVYVRSDCDLSGSGWVDGHETWSKTEGPGTHPPRSFAWLIVDGVKVVVAHQCPLRTDNTVAAQAEGFHMLNDLVGPSNRFRTFTKPALVMADWNHRKGDGSPYNNEAFARLIKGNAYGTRIDAAVGVNVKNVKVKYTEVVNKVRLMSDHKHCMWVSFNV